MLPSGAASHSSPSDLNLKDCGQLSRLSPHLDASAPSHTRAQWATRRTPHTRQSQSELGFEVSMGAPAAPCCHTHASDKFKFKHVSLNLNLSRHTPAHTQASPSRQPAESQSPHQRAMIGVHEYRPLWLRGNSAHSHKTRDTAPDSRCSAPRQGDLRALAGPRE